MSKNEVANSRQFDNISTNKDKTTLLLPKVVLGFKRERSKNSEDFSESKKSFSMVIKQKTADLQINTKQNSKNNLQNLKITDKKDEIPKRIEKKEEVSNGKNENKNENIQKKEISNKENSENQIKITAGEKICDFCKNSDTSQQFTLSEISSDVLKQFLFNKFNIKSEYLKNIISSKMQKYFDDQKEKENNKNDISICGNCIIKNFINGGIAKLFLFSDKKILTLKNLLNLNEKIYEKIKLININLKKILPNIENSFNLNENQKLQQNLNDCLSFLATNNTLINKLIENNDSDMIDDQNLNILNNNFSIHSNDNMSFIGNNKNQTNKNKKFQYAIYTKNYIHEVDNENYPKTSRTQILETKVPYIIQESETYKAKKNLINKNNLNNKENSENAINKQKKYKDQIKIINSINNNTNNNICTPMNNNINNNIDILKNNNINNNNSVIVNDNNINKSNQFDNFLINYLINSHQINQKLINKMVVDPKNSQSLQKDIISANNNILNTINCINSVNNAPPSNFIYNNNPMMQDNRIGIVTIPTMFPDNTNKIYAYKTNNFNNNNNFIKNIDNNNNNNNFGNPNQQQFYINNNIPLMECQYYNSVNSNINNNYINNYGNNYNSNNTISMPPANQISDSYNDINFINPNIYNIPMQKIEPSKINNNMNNMNNINKIQNVNNNINNPLYNSQNLEKENQIIDNNEEKNNFIVEDKKINMSQNMEQ